MRDVSKTMRQNSRRDYLKSIGGVAGMGLLAGCTGENGNGDGGNGDDGNGENDFPNRDIEIVVHYGYGSGGYNEYPRLVGQFMNEELPDGINTRVTNMEGANGRIGTRYVWNAEPDGHTILMINLQAQIVNQVLLQDEFEPDLREFTWLPQVAIDTSNLSVAPWSDIESFEDYVTRMEGDNPPVHATTSLSGSQTMGPVMIGELTGRYSGRKVIDNTVVFSTSADSIVAIGQEDVEVMFGSHSTNVPYLENNDLRPILNNQLLSPEESWEDLPHTEGAETVQSTDVLDQETAEILVDLFSSRRPFCAPPGTPDDVADYLRQVMTDAIQNPDLEQAGADINRPVEYGDSETVARAAVNGVETWNEYRDILVEVRDN